MKVSGFPSAAEEYEKGFLSLEELLVQNPFSTYYFRLKEDYHSKLQKGDLLIVDRSVELSENSLIIIELDYKLHLGLFSLKHDHFHSFSMKKKYDLSHLEWSLWGTVIHIIHSFKKKQSVCFS